MKTKLLPLIAFVSAAAMVPAANAAEDISGYVTDSSGAIVKDSSGQCVRNSSWSADKAIASCEAKSSSTPAAKKEDTASSAAPAAAAPDAAPKYTSETIMDNGLGAYVVDSQDRIVRDSMNRCVRTINWSKDTAIAKCEGWEEKKPAPKPAPVAQPKPEIKPFPAPAPKPEIKPMPVNEPMHFQGFFDFDSSELRDKAKTQLNDYADYMKAVDDVSLKITGHTDSIGTKAYNQGLSEQRAGAVKTYLEEQGVTSDRMTAIGKGESSPIASNKTHDGRAQNRRVEIEIVK